RTARLVRRNAGMTSAAAAVVSEHNPGPPLDGGSPPPSRALLPTYRHGASDVSPTAPSAITAFTVCQTSQPLAARKIVTIGPREGSTDSLISPDGNCRRQRKAAPRRAAR